MKIERDKWYLRRDGGREFVICTDKPGHWSIVTHNKVGNIHLFDARGSSCAGPYADLVAPVPEPARGYVVINNQGFPAGHYCLLHNAQSHAAGKRGYRILDLSTAKEVGDDQ